MKEKKISKENEKAEQPASSNEFEVENEETVANEREEMIRVKELEDEL